MPSEPDAPLQRLRERWLLRQRRWLEELDGPRERSQSSLGAPSLETELPDIAPDLELARAALVSWLERGVSSVSTPDTSASAAATHDFAEAPAEFLADQLALSLLARNQFAGVGASERDALRAVYRDSLARLRALLDRGALGAPALARELEVIEADEERALERWIASVPGGRTRTTCAEYSVELQLDALGLTVQDLLEPVLDVGCGQSALLVRALAARGIEAFGLDRHAHGPRVIRADFLDFDFGRGRFGTILSHQAFSLHFLHHHHAPGDAAYGYAQAYRRMLTGLREGGTFAYVPGLPFVERLLPAQTFRVEQKALRPELASALRASFGALGEDVAYACRVTRA